MKTDCCLTGVYCQCIGIDGMKGNNVYCANEIE